MPADIRDQVQRACDVIVHHLGRNLQSIHLYGSAVVGGLKPLSDLDLLVATDAALSADLRDALMTALLQVSLPPGSSSLRALEVTVVARSEVLPWRYPARRELQFGEWLRHDIQAGRFEPALLDHDLALLLTQVRQHSITLLGEPAAECFDPVPWDDVRSALAATLQLWNVPADWQGDERNVTLALARIWYTATAGDIASKDQAAVWAVPRLPAGHAAVMSAARRAYLGDESVSVTAEQLGELIRYLKPRIQHVLSQPQG